MISKESRIKHLKSLRDSLAVEVDYTLGMYRQTFSNDTRKLIKENLDSTKNRLKQVEELLLKELYE